MTQAWIRPVFRGEDGPLIGLALCRTNGACLVDEDVITHYPKDTPGRDIKLDAEEQGMDAEWGNILEVSEN